MAITIGEGNYRYSYQFRLWKQHERDLRSESLWGQDRCSKLQVGALVNLRMQYAFESYPGNELTPVLRRGEQFPLALAGAKTVKNHKELLYGHLVNIYFLPKGDETRELVNQIQDFADKMAKEEDGPVVPPRLLVMVVSVTMTTPQLPWETKLAATARVADKETIRSSNVTRNVDPLEGLLSTAETQIGDCCRICLQDFLARERIICLPCSHDHVFHWDCIANWLTTIMVGLTTVMVVSLFAARTFQVIDDDGR